MTYKAANIVQCESFNKAKWHILFIKIKARISNKPLSIGIE